MFMSKAFDDHLARAFNKYGQFISRNAVAAIIFSILLNGLLGINIRWIKFTRELIVYTPSNSQAHQDSLLYNRYFNDYTSSNFYEKSLLDLGRYGSIIMKAPEGTDILNMTLKTEINEIVATLYNVTITYENMNYSYKQLCARRNNTCFASHAFLYSDYFWLQVERHNISYPKFRMEDGNIIDLNHIFGGVHTNDDGLIISVQALKMMFYLRQDSNQYSSLASKWEEEFVKAFKSLPTSNLSIAFANSDSLGHELDDNTVGDVFYFSWTFSLMISYASFVSAGGNCVSQRGHLGRAGVFASGLAILGAFGLGGALQIEFVNIVGVMPFLVLGIGVDDMFIMMSAHSDAPVGKSPETRIGKAVQSSGVAVTITSLTNVVAFGVGMLSPFQSVRNFCFYSGSAVFLCYVNQMTFFLGCMSIQEKRVAAQRHCMTCVKMKSRDELDEEGAHCCRKVFCSGSAATSRNDQESFLQKIPTAVFPKLVLWVPMKIGILITFLAYLGVSIYGAIHLEKGLSLRNVVSPSSYYHSYSTWDYDHFPSTFIISFVVSGQVDYSSITTQNKIESLLKKVKQDIEIDSGKDFNWLSAYVSSNLYNNSSEHLFCLGLKTYLSFNSVYANDVIFDKNCTINHSRFYLSTRNIKDSYQQGKFMLRIRDNINSSLNVFAYSPAFIYFEQYVAVLPNTLKTVGISIVSVLLVTIIFMSHPLVVLFVSFSMAFIMTGLFGFMYLWGLSLSSFTMVLIIMSVGFSVDHCTHICHAFLTVEGENRNVRVFEAIVRSGGPIFNGAMSTLVGIITLAFAESYVFTSFFKIMLLVILFGLGHAIFLLPVVLSLFGPHKKSEVEKKVVFNQEKMSQDVNGYFPNKMAHDNKGFYA